MRWFKHDTDASADAKLKKVRHKYGFTGYGLYWYLIECIASNVSKSNITFELEEDSETIAIDWRIDQSQVEEMLLYMIKINLFGSEGGTVNCFKLAKRLDDTNSKHPQIKQLLKVIGENINTENKTLIINESEEVGLNRSESDFVSPDQIRSDQIRVDKRLKDIVEKSKIEPIDLEIEIDTFPIIETEEEPFNDPNDYEAFLASEQNAGEGKKADRKKAREKKLSDAEDAFKIFWNAGMRKAGDKKKALSKFVSLAGERKQSPEDFAQFLKEDIQRRISTFQMGFDLLLPTTYLNGSRFEDDFQQSQSQVQNQKGLIKNESSYPREFTASLDGTENAAVIKIKYAQFERKQNEALNEQDGSTLDQDGRSIL